MPLLSFNPSVLILQRQTFQASMTTPTTSAVFLDFYLTELPIYLKLPSYTTCRFLCSLLCLANFYLFFSMANEGWTKCFSFVPPSIGILQTIWKQTFYIFLNNYSLDLHIFLVISFKRAGAEPLRLFFSRTCHRTLNMSLLH